MEKKLSDLSVVELKATAYDLLSQLQLIQHNLKVVNTEIENRFNQSNQSSVSPISNSGGSVETV